MSSGIIDIDSDSASDLSGVSDEDLEHELERRRSGQAIPPDMLPEQNFASLCCMIPEIVGQACRDGAWPRDHKVYIYEAAMEAVYGPGFWAWRRSVRWSGE